MLKGHAAVFLICVGFAAAGFLRLNDLSLYTPDSIRYVIWGTSVAHGHGFVDTTTPVPDRFVLNAPLYAVLIAPSQLFFPFSLIAAKVWTLLWGVMALMLFYVWLRKTLGQLPAVIGATILALNPLMLMYSTEALSELPFVVFLLAIFLLLERAERGGLPLWACALVPSIALLRESGVALVCTLAFVFIIRREFSRVGAIASGCLFFIGGWFVRNYLLVGAPSEMENGNVGYLMRHFVTPDNASIFKEIVLRCWIQFKEYFFMISGMMFYPHYGARQVATMYQSFGYYDLFSWIAGTGRYFIVAGLLPLMIYGMIIDLRTSASGLIRLLFGCIYLLIVLSYPILDVRFLFPLFPIMIFYSLGAMRALVRSASLFGILRKPAVAALIAMAFLLPDVAGIHTLAWASLSYRESPLEFARRLENMPSYPTMYTQPWTLLGDWIREKIPAGAVIATPSKELSIVVGDRKVLEIDPGVTLPMFEKLLRDNDVEYILAPLRWRDMYTYEFLMRSSGRFGFEPLHRAANLSLLKVHSLMREGAGSMQASIAVMASDTTTASGLLRAGMNAIVRCSFTDALHYLNGADSLAPDQPEILYQMFTASSQTCNTTGATSLYNRILTLPQAGSFIFAGRAQLLAMTRICDTTRDEMGEQRDVRVFQAASNYWGLGYRNYSLSLMRQLLSDSSRFFDGLLWGLHHARELGDLVSARQFLRQLTTIDSSYAVVRTFGRILAIDESLHSNAGGVSREIAARRHLALAGMFRQLELYEEAVDEAEMALSESTDENSALIFLGDEFVRRSLPRPALKYYRRVAESGSAPAEVVHRLDSLDAIRRNE